MILQVQHLNFSYDGVPALRDVSFEVAPGSVLCVMGPNGSGKSTLIDTILGLHDPDSGTILLNGQDLRSLDRKSIARLAAYVPQNHAVTFPFTVREAVSLGGDADTQGAIAGGITAAVCEVPEDILSECLDRLDPRLADVIESFNEVCNHRTI